MAKHMTLDTRKGIAHGLDCGLKFAEIAGTFSRAESTIANEVKNRMIWSNKGYGCTNAVCEHFETCSKIFRTSYGKKLPFKNQRKCFEMCEGFRPRTCNRPVCLQRMRQAERLSAQEALLHRGRSAGELPRDSQ